MKKIIYLVVLSLALNACTDEDITFTPYNSVSESIVLRNAGDFENMLTGAYSYMIKMVEMEVTVQNLLSILRS